jgi:hypothetical protein
MNFNRTLANQFIDTLLDVVPKKRLGVYNEDGFPVFYYEILDSLQYFDPSVELHFGATKLVIVTPNLEGVVIKIPFLGRYYPRYNANWETSDPDENYEFCEYSGVDSDYCAVELSKYEEVKQAHLERFLAQTERFRPDASEILGTVLIQEETLAEVDRWEKYKTSKKASDTAQKMTTAPMKTEWVALCIDEYGSDLVNDFFKYCDEEDDGTILEDCHAGNYGYRIADRTPCIFDFSSYLD